jgi:hypothetical protein
MAGTACLKKPPAVYMKEEVESYLIEEKKNNGLLDWAWNSFTGWFGNN